MYTLTDVLAACGATVIWIVIAAWLWYVLTGPRSHPDAAQYARNTLRARSLKSRNVK